MTGTTPRLGAMIPKAAALRVHGWCDWERDLFGYVGTQNIEQLERKEPAGASCLSMLLIAPACQFPARAMACVAVDELKIAIHGRGGGEF